jgi:hypothetical protein
MTWHAGQIVVLLALVLEGEGLLWAQGRPAPRRTTPAGERSSQYFGRGFDLEQGPDFAVAMDGIPLNLPSALKAPGFLDDDLLIPETIEGLRYRRGPYQFGQGAFALAGSADLQPVDSFERPALTATYGPTDSDRFGRLLWAATHTGAAKVTYAVEGSRSYRPWDDWQGSAKLNAFLRVAPASSLHGWNFTVLATAERGDGGSPPPDRPEPATVPGDSNVRVGDGYHYRRVLLGLNRTLEREGGVTDHVQFYGGASTLRDWGTSTYFLRDGFWGDQLRLTDRRSFLGAEAQRRWERHTGAVAWTHRAGAQGRFDDVVEAEVLPTFDRAPIENREPLLRARGELLHGTVHGQTTARWGTGWHAFAGLRVDTQVNRVTGPLTGTLSSRSATLVSPRLGMGYSPWAGTQVRAAWGQGFRPGNAFRDTRPMVRAHSADLGFQTRPAEPWETSLTLWAMDLESEAVFDPGQSALVLAGPSRRRGLEWYNECVWGPWRAEVCLAWSRARWRNAPAGEDHVPGSIPQTGHLGLAWKTPTRAVRLSFRSLGAYALSSDGKVTTGRQKALNLRVKRTWAHWSVAVEAQNAFNLRKNSRAYYYTSRLRGEPAQGVLATHTKHADPQAIRLEVSRRF